MEWWLTWRSASVNASNAFYGFVMITCDTASVSVRILNPIISPRSPNCCVALTKQFFWLMAILRGRYSHFLPFFYAKVAELVYALL